jgi:cell division protein FtsZ
MVFITAGMGGGTGTGAAPVIARMAKEIKLEAEDSDDPTQILVVAVVTTPFLFEGFRRLQQAQEGVEELRKYVDSILVINNEKLRAYGDLVMTDAFAMANDVLLTAVKGIAEIITLNAYVNIDFRDVYTVMENSGTALMGIGEGEGEKRAKQAVEEATTSVLLNDNDIKGAKNVLLHFSFGPEHEITMDEMGEVTDYITQKTGSRETNVIWGMGTDDTLGDKVKITLLASGFGLQNIPGMEEVEHRRTREEEEERRQREEEQEERDTRRQVYYGGDDNRPQKPRRQIFLFAETDLDNDDIISMVESTPTVDRKKEELRRIQEKSNRETTAVEEKPAVEEDSDAPAFTITF